MLKHYDLHFFLCSLYVLILLNIILYFDYFLIQSNVYKSDDEKYQESIHNSISSADLSESDDHTNTCSQSSLNVNEEDNFSDSNISTEVDNINTNKNIDPDNRQNEPIADLHSISAIEENDSESTCSLLSDCELNLTINSFSNHENNDTDEENSADENDNENDYDEIDDENSIDENDFFYNESPLSDDDEAVPVDDQVIF